ncbi:unnamed protein product, partial [Closterium sp. NIES-65]
RSARSTFPSLEGFRQARLRGFRRVFCHAAPVFFIRGIANSETREYSSLSVEPCEGEEIVVTLFSIPATEVPAFMEREHEFRFLLVPPSRLSPVAASPGSAAAESASIALEPTRGAVICSRYSDREYFQIRLKGDTEEYERQYGRWGVERVWDDSLLPCRVYLRHCVLAAQGLGEEALASFLDHTFLADRQTTLRQYLLLHPNIMSELPPPSLADSYAQNTQSVYTTPNSLPPASANTTTPATAGPETQESQIPDRSNTPTTPSTTPTVTSADYWVYQIPSPSASYDADDDYVLGAAFDDSAAPGEVEEEPAAQPTMPSTTTAAASRHSTARNSPRWTPEEECEVLATFIDLDSQIRARTGQQGRSWYPLVQRDILERIPTWRHDQGALKAKFNRLKAEWRRINDRIRRSGEGRVTNLPPWYHLSERLWGERPSTIPPVLTGTGIAPAGMATARPAPPAATNTRATPTVATPHPPTSSPSQTAAARRVTAPRPPAPVSPDIPAVIPTPDPATSRITEPASPGLEAGALAPSRPAHETPLSPDTIAPSNGGSPNGGTVPSGSTTGISIRGRRITWGARPSSDGGEGCSRNAWWQYPRKQDGQNEGKKKNGASRGVGRKAVKTKKSSSTAEFVGELREHFDKRQDAKWEEFKSLTREVFRGYADERRSRRRRSPQSTSSSEDEA